MDVRQRSHPTDSQPDVLVFFGLKPHTLDERPPSPHPDADKAITRSHVPFTGKLRPELAVALGGLAGNNAHGAGFLEALRRAEIMPQIISCTSGQLRCVEVFLKRHDVFDWFKQRLEESQPFGSYTDANILYKMTPWQSIRLSAIELPFDLATTCWRFWNDALYGIRKPADFSLFREAWNIWPARSLVCQEPDSVYERMAETFAAEKEVGVIFNAYDFSAAEEIVYMNDCAFRLTGKKAGTKNENRPWVRYQPIDASAVKNALRLYEYGFADGSHMLDGAYSRDIILSEIPDHNNRIETIAVARPQELKWRWTAPLSWAELKDMQTKINFNGTYIGERDRIRLLNRLSDKRYRRIEILELPMDLRRSWWDYALEDVHVFRRAFWRGLDLANSLYPDSMELQKTAENSA